MKRRGGNAIEAHGSQRQQPLVGTTLGNYRVLELIGTGGMGEVYRARDERLNRTVAIKSLRGALATDEIARRRFVRETRLACKVVHPYVATVFDVTEHEGNLFLVMEHIEGRRLDQVLRDDRPGPQEMARYGVEIAEALTAIHGQGLVHRDLKPGNVMVTPTGHVKVMDFGVARSLVSGEFPKLGDVPPEHEPTLTQEGLGVGTVAYMSPEQVRAERVDSRSDLFALGTILYEAITGEHPFARGSVMETASAILNESPGGGEEPRTLTESGPMRQVVLRLLEKDPDRRYQDAETVVGELQGVVEGHGLGLVPQAAPHNVVSRYVIPAILALVLGIASLWLWSQYRTAPPEVPTPPRTLIAVLPFLDQTLDDPGRFRGEMIAALLAADLAESRVVRSVGSDRIAEILENLPGGSSRVEQLEKVGEAVAAEWVLAGSLFRDGDAYQAAVDVYRAGMPDPFGSFRVEAARTAGLVDLASMEVRRVLFPDASPEEENDPGAAVISSSSEEARELVYRAHLAARAFRLAEARDLLERALRIDPEFILAHSALAKVLDTAGYSTEARRRAETAARLVKGPPAAPTRRIELEVEAVHAMLFDDFEREAQAREELARLYPDEPGTLNGAGWALVRNAGYDQALGYVERSLGLDDKNPTTYRLQARVLRALGRHDAAAVSLDEAERLYRTMDSSHGLAVIADERGYLEWLRGDLETSVQHFLDAAKRFEQVGLEVEAARSLANAGDCNLVRGEHARARELYEQTMTVFRQAGAFRRIADNLDKLGASLFVRGELQEAEVVLRDAVEQAEEIGNPALVLSSLSNLASLTIYRGRLVEGQRMAERALQLAQERGDRQREVANRTMLADAYFQQGELDRARRAYEDLIDLEESPGGSQEGLAWALTGLAEIEELQGDLEQASESMDRAVTLADETGRRVVRGYTRLRRALVAGDLAEWGQAEADLGDAEALANEEGQPLEDLLHRIGLSRGTLALLRGEWSVAEPLLDAAREAGARTGANGVEGPALNGVSEAALRLGRPDRAVRLARRSISMPRGRALDQTIARVALASALADQGQTGEAREVASQALTEAEAMNVPLVAARAAAILVSLPDPPGRASVEDARPRGVRALESYLDRLSERRREGVESRIDVREAIEALKGVGDARPAG